MASADAASSGHRDTLMREKRILLAFAVFFVPVPFYAFIVGGLAPSWMLLLVGGGGARLVLFCIFGIVFLVQRFIVYKIYDAMARAVPVRKDRRSVFLGLLLACIAIGSFPTCVVMDVGGGQRQFTGASFLMAKIYSSGPRRYRGYLRDNLELEMEVALQEDGVSLVSVRHARFNGQACNWEEAPGLFAWAGWYGSITEGLDSERAQKLKRHTAVRCGQVGQMVVIDLELKHVTRTHELGITYTKSIEGQYKVGVAGHKEPVSRGSLQFRGVWF